MRALLRHVHRTFGVDEAEQVAVRMQAEDGDWTYIAKHCPAGTGRSVVEVYDEEGHFIERL